MNHAPLEKIDTDLKNLVDENQSGCIQALYDLVAILSCQHEAKFSLENALGRSQRAIGKYEASKSALASFQQTSTDSHA